jgi:hypothetical protein
VLTHPYVTAQEFRFHPTFLDSRNLVTGGTNPQQDASLTNLLLEASVWADEKVDMPLGAHVRTERSRLMAGSNGQLRYHPEHAPVIAVTSLAFGATPDTLNAQTDPQVWTESDGRIVVAFSPSSGAGLGSLQFGSPPAAVEQLVQWTYVAGFPATQLAEPATAGATTLTVLDTTGILAGTVLRLWTPGLAEAVTVSSVSGDELTLSRAVTNAHPAGGSCSALPATARQAIINYTCMLLMRPAGGGESNYGKRAPSPSATSTDSRRQHGGGGVFYDDACKLLRPFKRIR